MNFRDTPDEQARIASLLRMMPEGGVALEIGARDCYITRLMSQRHDQVVALDLSKPQCELDNVRCVAGDVRALELPDAAFDVVLCSEVLEHLDPHDLPRATSELQRVCRGTLVVGVPFEQDLRVGRTICAHCRAINPPYAHLNRFDETRLTGMFRPFRPLQCEHIGETRHRTNAVSDFLMRQAGYPWGTYEQDEGCVRCGRSLVRPRSRGLYSRALAFAAQRIDRVRNRHFAGRAKWVHFAFAADAQAAGGSP